jgi:hypothetical protein
MVSDQFLESPFLTIAVGLELHRQGMAVGQLPDQLQQGFFQAGQPLRALGT